MYPWGEETPPPFTGHGLRPDNTPADYTLLTVEPNQDPITGERRRGADGGAEEASRGAEVMMQVWRGGEAPREDSMFT